MTLTLPDTIENFRLTPAEVRVELACSLYGRGLIGRAAWQRVLAALEAQRLPDGKLGLTFEVIYGHAFRPAPRQTAAGESIVRFQPRKP